jgi:hypothetical protein
MASQKQTEANRLNAQKSTGPRGVPSGPEGKAASSMNALKSGIDAKSQIIRGEKAANLETLKTEYYDRYHPTAPEQRMLVDTLIDAEWLLRRFRVVEAQLWEQGAQFALKPEPEIELAKALRDNAEYFTRLQRRIDTAQRNYRNALQELQHLQAENRPLPDPEPAPQSARPAPPRNRPVTPANGFVPKADPQNPTESQSSPSPRVVSPDRDLVL